MDIPLLVEADLIVPADDAILLTVTTTTNTKCCRCAKGSKPFPAYNPLLLGQNIYPNTSYLTKETS